MTSCLMQDAAPAMAQSADNAAMDLGLDLGAAQHTLLFQLPLAPLLNSALVLS